MQQGLPAERLLPAARNACGGPEHPLCENAAPAIAAQISVDPSGFGIKVSLRTAFLQAVRTI
ncbi:hypothetical protein [Leisingera methylohalidivorans]|uniref:Uncharacterized protein n=1 Tax=Leisingera methylohalidivorans DSM 14336 TaxID=999552 RepID=V9VZE2_9RHOB|nr:hypothetical protein [Leisingera methylohalidivorans]AHD03159.1 hypothetical protein METH_14865 [Leisingera methylohalidivorans DSM 14336]